MIESYFVRLEDPVTANIGLCDSDHVIRSGWSYVFLTSPTQSSIHSGEGNPCRYRPKANDHPVSSGAEGWLVNHEQQQKLCYDKPDAAGWRKSPLLTLKYFSLF